VPTKKGSVKGSGRGDFTRHGKRGWGAGGMQEGRQTAMSGMNFSAAEVCCGKGTARKEEKKVLENLGGEGSKRLDQK